MICAVSHSSITKIMLNAEVNSMTNAFKFVLSQDFIDYVNNKLADNPAEVDLFRNWIASRGQFADRMRYIDKSEINKYFNNNKNEEEINASCAYFAGHFIFDETKALSNAYVSYGIDAASVNSYRNYLGRGDNPIFEKTLSDRGTDSPDCLCKYFKGEVNVVFIDNYINNKSISFIKHVISGLCKQATINVVTKRTSLVKASNLHKEIGAIRPDISVNLLSFDNDKEFHDRHIAVGDRIHIRSTSGLDAFAYDGEWINREGTFSVYDVHEKANIKKFDAIDSLGNKVTFSIKMVML